MPKKKKGGGGGANWMDTYGDMVTLLLCFFVLLYSMSTISEDKWKALVQSFNPMAMLTPTDIPGGTEGPISDPENEPGGIPADPNDAAQREIDDMIDDLYNALLAMASEDGMASTIAVSMDGGKVYVRFNDTVFFGGDSFALTARAREVLSRVVVVLNEASDAIEEIRVQGHTAQQYANEPNPTPGDRRLASNRATEVVIFLQENSIIHPARLVDEGWGQWHPISPNDTEEHRRANRRVELVISGRNLDEEALNQAISKYITDDQPTQTAQDE